MNDDQVRSEVLKVLVQGSLNLCKMIQLERDAYVRVYRRQSPTAAYNSIREGHGSRYSPEQQLLARKKLEQCSLWEGQLFAIIIQNSTRYALYQVWLHMAQCFWSFSDTGQISTKLWTNQALMKGIQIYSHPFPKGDNDFLAYRQSY